MKSAGSMLLSGLAAGVLSVLTLALPACVSRRDDLLVRPEVLTYPGPSVGGDRLWAVVPPRNESGTSAVDVLRIGDQLAAAITEAHGLRALPMNRVLDAMRVLDIDIVDDPSQASKLAQALGVDGLILGSITAFDPYDPPTIGISLALLDQTGLDASGGRLNPRVLSEQATAYSYFPRTTRQSVPASSVAMHLDGRNHEVLASIRSYAQGRHDDDGAYGWRRYLASMDLYERFAAHVAIGELLEGERLRLERASAGVDP